ncbi:MAG: FprA family A-type flavoprotein [Lachnospiraceae bacterium]
MNNILNTSIVYTGVNDKTIDLFEGQYMVPNGVSYNSYVILDDKITVLDTVDARASEEWFANLESALGSRKPDYLVVSHLEPDHSANIRRFMEKYPNTYIVSNAKTFAFLPQFFENMDIEGKTIVVKEGDVLQTGRHSLKFFMAPMVHWPEVMMTYDETDKVLFSADAFGKFGALDTDEDWVCEARRYYFNIVGKYGVQVQAVLKKLGTLEVQTICPLHGPVLSDNLEYYIGKYQLWSSYEPEDKGVLIAYASMHGNTAKAARKMKEFLEEKGIKTAITDLARDDMAQAVGNAFRYDRLILASPTYDAGIMTYMESFLYSLKHKNYQKRTVALIENGTWAPLAAKKMKEALEGMKDIEVLERVVTIRTEIKEKDLEEMRELAKELEE